MKISQKIILILKTKTYAKMVTASLLHHQTNETTFGEIPQRVLSQSHT